MGFFRKFFGSEVNVPPYKPNEMEHNFLQLTLWLEKVPGKGEDSNPLVRSFAGGSGVVAVFDGLGGSGSTRYEWEEEDFTGAWIASRLAKATLASWFSWFHRQKDNSFDEVFPSYSEAVLSVLENAHKHLDKNPSKLKSSLIRSLPSTLSGIYFIRESETFKCWSFNSGDSRSYVFDPVNGISQVTLDDIVQPGDALDTLLSSTRISTCLSAEGKFKISVNAFQVQSPCVFIAASDGCFDYVTSPLHFEYLLLDHLQQSENQGQWAVRMSSAFRSFAGDDVSMGMAICGWDSFEDFRAACTSRLEKLKQSGIIEMEKLIQESKEKPEMEKEFEEARMKFWEEYKPGYERILRTFNNDK